MATVSFTKCSFRMKAKQGFPLALLSLVLSFVALAVASAALLDAFPQREGKSSDWPGQQRVNVDLEITGIAEGPAAPPETFHEGPTIKHQSSITSSSERTKTVGSIGKNLSVDEYLEPSVARDPVEIGETLDVLTYVRAESGDTVNIGPNLSVEDFY